MKIARYTLLALALATSGVLAGECNAPKAGDAAATTAAPTPAAPAPARVLYYNPWADMLRMQTLMDRQMNMLNAMPMPIMVVPAPDYAPVAQGSTLQSTPEGYRIDVPLQGFKAEDIKVRLDGTLLSITAQSNAAADHERSSRSFVETLTLPGPVQAEELKQHFKDGVLTITLPTRKNPAGGA